MEYKDYYKILGLERNASESDIKNAYRKLARKYHPDVSKEADAEKKFKEVGEAYKVLKDPETRAAYDRLGANWQQGQEFRPPPGWDAGFEFRGGPDLGGDYSEFFEDLFGRGFGGFSTHGRGFSGKGQDHHAKVLIDIDDAYHGATRSITLQVPELDDHGRMHTRQRTLNVRIPRGVKEGQHIRLSGQGAPGIGGGPAGDLYLEVGFSPHRYYSVDGRDVHLQLPVTPWEAALGATVKVPTPEGPVDMKVPAGSSGGRKMRLKGRGIPGTQPGDLYVELRIEVPPATSEEAKALYRKMEQTLRFNPRSKLGV